MLFRIQYPFWLSVRMIAPTPTQPVVGKCKYSDILGTLYTRNVGHFVPVYPTLEDKIYLTDNIQASKFALLLEFVILIIYL